MMELLILALLEEAVVVVTEQRLGFQLQEAHQLQSPLALAGLLLVLMEMIQCSVASQALVVVVALRLAVQVAAMVVLVALVAHGLERLVAITPAVLETHLAHLHRKALLAALLETQAVAVAAVQVLSVGIRVEPMALTVAQALHHHFLVHL